MNRFEGSVILVTGAGGFIGKHLVSRLAAIPAVQLLLSSRVRPAHGDGNRWVIGDLATLTADYWRDARIDRIDYVFHLAGFTPRSRDDADRVDASIDGTILGTRTLLQGLPPMTRRVIYASTADVYAPPSTAVVLTEFSALGPTTLYAASKVFTESLVRAWARARNCSYAVLRYGNIYGPGEHHRYRKLIPVAIQRAFAQERFVLDGDGRALRDYLYVGDAVEATIRAAAVDGDIEALNVVRGDSVTVEEVAVRIARLLGTGDPIRRPAEEAQADVSLRFDNSLMKRLLGDWRMVDMEAGLSAEIDVMREHLA